MSSYEYQTTLNHFSLNIYYGVSKAFINSIVSCTWHAVSGLSGVFQDCLGSSWPSPIYVQLLWKWTSILWCTLVGIDSSLSSDCYIGEHLYIKCLLKSHRNWNSTQSQNSCQVERPDISHFPRLSLTQSVVFSWDHTHQVCLALVLQCSLASQLPLWPCSVYSPSNNLYCDEHTIVW